MADRLNVGELARQLYHYRNVTHLSERQAREMATPFAQVTEFGNLNFHSNVRNRSAGLTVYVGGPEVRQKSLSPRQQAILDDLPQTLLKVQRYLDRAPIVCTRRTMGDNEHFNPHCTLYVSTYAKDTVRIAYMWGETLLDYRPQLPGPDISLIFVPEWPEQERQILVFAEEGVTLVLGSDYMGEAKKGFLRMGMWHAKQSGMLGVHAGSKIVEARGADGKLRRCGMLLFGLSATGKTTHSCHTHGLGDEGESMEVVQDDVCFLRENGEALGTERGFYLKTEGLDPHSQPLLYQAAIQSDTVFENVMVDAEGHVDFQDESITSNGRGVVQMAHFAPHASDSINLPPVSELDGLLLIFITRRNTVVPVVSKLDANQAAAAFMLGESVESSAGDPKRAGESVRVVGTNPFIIGDEAAEGNWICDFIQRHRDKVQAYLINTGGTGEIREKLPDGTSRVRREVTRIQIPETSALFRSIVRGKVQWVEEPHFGTQVPAAIEGVDLQRFDIDSHYSKQEIEEHVGSLKRERREYLDEFPGLNRAVIEAIAD
jgi:phosphoenolpyruvate carboxykinase (ATP)